MGWKFRLGYRPKNVERKRRAGRSECLVVSFPMVSYDMCSSLDCLRRRIQQVQGLPSGKFAILFYLL